MNSVGNTLDHYSRMHNLRDNYGMPKETPVARVIATLMERKGIESGNALAQMAKADQPMIWRLLAGKVKSPRADTVAPLLRFFGITYAQLLGDEPLSHETQGHNNTLPGPDITMLVPLVSWVQAGQWREIIDNYQPGDFERVIPVSKNMSPRSFALRVHGDSMEPKFPEGCTIVIDPEREPKNGSFVIARTNGDNEATFKQIVFDAGRVYLKPLNSRYPIIEMAEGSKVCGVVRHMLTDFE